MSLHETLTAYAAQGWHPMVLPPRAKFPPPAGMTGATGLDAEADDLALWAATYPSDSNVAVRMSADVIGLDVDNYDGKPGADSLAALVSNLGPLPDTWVSTARGSEAGPGTSGIRFYRVPLLEGEPIKFVSLPGEGIETIQRVHRYAVVWPSVNPKNGAVYRWFDPQGRPAAGPPAASELPDLPLTWVAGLAVGAVQQHAAPASAADGAALLAALDARGDEAACSEVASLAQSYAERFTADTAAGMARHDSMLRPTFLAVARCAAGHTGWAQLRGFLASLWDSATAGEDRGAEFEALLLGAAQKVATEWPQISTSDPCRLAAMATQAPPTQALDLARAWTDRELARAVLDHTAGRVRFLTDTDRWLVLGANGVWTDGQATDAGAGARVVLNRALDFVLRGDANAEAGSDEHTRHRNVTRLGMSAGAGACASMMLAYARDADYPHALRSTDLDSDPHVLWAGGVAWDLRASAGRLVQANVAPDTPHLRTAPCAPRIMPTPLWDGWLAAAFPDAAQRAWVLRLLGASLVGYAQKQLGIFGGEPDTGKTTTLELVASALGTGPTGYATMADRRLLGDENHHASILLELSGRRFAYIDEGPRRGKASMERLKALTGGGHMTANAMRSNPVTFKPTHTLFLTSNDDPELTDPAVRSRVRLVECTGDLAEVRAARAEIGDLDGHAWRAELPGVLAQLIMQASEWLAAPSSTDNPADVQLALDTAAAEQDVLGQWITGALSAGDGWTQGSSLYAAYREHAATQGIPAHRIESHVTFGTRLRKAGLVREHRKTGAVWLATLRQYRGSM